VKIYLFFRTNQFKKNKWIKEYNNIYAHVTSKEM